MKALPADIRQSFLPFARPDWVEGMLLGDDLDSLLSGMYLQAKFGWPVLGVYTEYTRLWLCEPSLSFQEKCAKGKILAVDLDIYQPTIPSVGHHILALRATDELPGHTHTLNPNLLRGVTAEQHYKQKYPLSTLHFLCWLFGETDLPPHAEQLLWLSDSSFINAQWYAPNMGNWCDAYLQNPDFSRLCRQVQHLDFEQDLQKNILQALSVCPLCLPGHTKYKSQHLGLAGFQCRYQNPAQQNAALQMLCTLLAKLSGWPRLDFPTRFAAQIIGQRHSCTTQHLPARGSLGDWLDEKGVFSYAFTYQNQLNYTVF